MTRSPRVWVLADDRPGTANQALGVAEALGWPFAARAIRYGPLAYLPNALLGASLRGLSAAARAEFVPPWPELVIGAGRRAAPVARWLKRRNPDCMLVQLMWPGSARGFDLIAVPEHDARPAAANVIATLGAPHRLTPEGIAAAAARLEPALSHLPRPRIACLVGGSSRHVAFTPEDARALAGRAGALAAARGGSLLVTTSRRTGAACEQALEGARPAGLPAWLYRFSAGGENPYPGLLGCADAVVVTADSASMGTEACASGKPVFLFTPQGGTAPKFARLQDRLQALGYLRPLGAPWPGAVPPPLYPQRAVADAIRARRERRPAAARPTVAVASSGAAN